MAWRWLLCLIFLLCIGCGSANSNARHQRVGQWMKLDEKKKILCTTAMVADLVQRVGGDRIDVLTLIGPEHDLTPTSSSKEMMKSFFVLT